MSNEIQNEDVKRKSELAKLSLVFACLSWLIPLFIGNILAIVFGFRALKEIRTNPNLAGKKMAVWGIALGFILVPLGFIAVLLFMRMLYPEGGH